jgi:hypothetical protein
MTKSNPTYKPKGHNLEKAKGKWPPIIDKESSLSRRTIMRIEDQGDSADCAHHTHKDS